MTPRSWHDALLEVSDRLDGADLDELRLAAGELHALEQRVLVRLGEPKPPLRLGELAGKLNCTRRFLQKLVRAGGLKAGRVGRDLRIPAPEAERLLREAGILSEPREPRERQEIDSGVASVARACSEP